MASWRSLPTMDYYRRKSRFNVFLVPRSIVGGDDRDVVPRGRKLNVVLVGMTGSGKSATGNSILGRRAFQSRLSQSAVTETSQWASRSCGDREILVVDTPGVYDNRMSATCDGILSEIGGCVQISRREGGGEGPHAILLVVSANCRLTEEQAEAVNTLRRLFGGDFARYLVVVFTRGDALEEDGVTLEQFLARKPAFLEKLLGECRHRCLLFNNKTANVRKQRRQVSQLVRTIDEMRASNGFVTFQGNPVGNVKEAVSNHQKQQRNLLFLGLGEYIKEGMRDLGRYTNSEIKTK